MGPEELVNAIDRYFALEKEIKETFGWVDSWKLLPLDDARGEYWLLAGDDKITGRDCTMVHGYEGKPITLEEAKEGKVAGSAVYTQRDHDRWIFRVGNVVLIPVDTGCDGNILLSLLDAKKEITDPKIENVYRRYWGDGDFDNEDVDDERDPK